MTLQAVLEAHRDTVPTAVALVARGDDVEFAAVGEDTRESVFPIASVTKPIVAAAALRLAGDGVIGLDDPIATWLPELAHPLVVRTPDAGVGDVVPATGPITVRHLLASRSGWGFTADFSLPATRKLLAEAHLHGVEELPTPDEWLKRLALVPLLHQPGDGWTYNTSYDVLGVLLDRVTGSLPGHLAERFCAPLGMTGTSFAGPALPSGAGGLRSTVDDLLAFGRFLLSGDLLAELAVDTTTAGEREAGRIFLEGQGWGFGGSVDIVRTDPWNVPGRYGWVGGSGTSFHVVPTHGTVTILLTRTAMTGPAPLPVMRDFWRSAVQTA
ncbi:CubicO group peptidase, beta-lactamase class C family [Lentzea xinjiangensis]|uniref:CubicO group peptidase, beta-lactamase class C family n=1 Tax=Lentzea xinjiangensis TaxID=402600 RepID=A0A1H9AA97_9PSEU|nr:serine hydrolase domain-containing protein [Lentzea xinjiangensis]SEP73580.1 CubicO group peptidase, beta-lactamase class C family [Lentzea xinjiangensis]